MKKTIIVMILVLYLLSCSGIPASASITGFNETGEYASLASEIKSYPQLDIVKKVDGFKKFEPHWNDRFPQGSTLMVYADALDVSHARFILVDFIFIITDPMGHIVSWERVEVRKVGYDQNAYVVYEKQIPDDWIDGTYRIKAFVYDRTNFTKIMQYEYNYVDYIGDEDYWDDFWDLGDDDDDNTEAGFANPLSRSKVVMRFREQPFYIDHRASVYPPDRFVISDLRLLPGVVAPAEESYLTVNVTNTFTDGGEVEVIFVLDNRTTGVSKVAVEPYSTEMVDFVIPPQEEGEHHIRITSPSSNVANVPIDAILNVSMEGAEEASSELPTNFVVKSLDIEKIQVRVNETVPIGVTVQNQGQTGNGTILIEINGEPAGEKNLSLRYLQTETVYFNITEKNTGTYRVTIPDTQLARLFFVTEETESTTSVIESVRSAAKEKGVSAGIIALILILLLLLLGLRIYISRR